VANAITNGTLKSAYQHYVLFGQFEGRPGVTVGPFTNSGVAPGTGATSALTTGIDALVGTNGNDTFVGSNSGATTSTLNLGDTINGGNGVDTLRVVNNQAAALPSIVTTSVETYEISSSANSSLAVNAQSTGLTTVNFVGGANTTFAVTNVAATTAFGLTTEAGQISVTANNVTGASDAVSLALNGTASTASFTENGIETFNVTTSGAASTLASLNSDTLKTLNVTGSAGLTITGALADTVTTVNASAATGGVNVLLGAADVTATGGSGNDRFAFAGNLNTNDSVVGGAGTDTVAITGVDLTNAANVAQLNALNTKVTGVEVLEFTGNVATTIQGGTGTGAFTNTEITKLLFNTDAADIINQAGSTRTYAFGELNTGNATINLAAGATSVNVSLEAIADTATPSNTGADVATLAINLDAGAVAGSTSTVNLLSTGPGTVANTITSLSAVAGSTYNITGSHDLTVSGLAAGGTVNASSFTGKLTLTGSGVNDSITTGTAGSTITAGAGVDTINFSASAGARDVHNITGITAAADRDVVTGFTVGTAATADQIRFADADTTHVGTGAAAIQAITAAPTAALTFNTTASDVLALNFNLSGTTLGASGATDGTALLAAIGQTVSVSATTHTGYIAAYQNGNAYLYHVVEGADGDAAVAAADITLVGVYNNVSVGGLTANNFDVTA